MADYGNNFTSNSGNYYYKTNGHNYDDSPWVIVNPLETRYSTGALTYFPGWPNTYPEQVGNNTKTYSNAPDINMWGIGAFNNYSYAKNSYYVAYYTWEENRNLKGSITGDFTCYPFNDKSSSKMIEPTGLDDTNHGVSPYVNSDNNSLYRTTLSIKGTTNTAGYRRHKIRYIPDVHRNVSSYDNGNIDGMGNTVTSTEYNKYDDYTYNVCQETVNVERYDALQTFYNEEDPYAVLDIYIYNHDNITSSSPVFCSLTNNKSEYRISHSYSCNPYVNTASWNNTNYLSFTYNTLPTYPKNLVFTYDSNWNGVSYDGGDVKIEAKAWYNNSYDRFTTSTATDDGFSTYKRYVDVSYYLNVHNSSTVPSGTFGYTFRIWQPGSTLGISYSWSIDGSPSWAHLSTTSGNKTTVTFDDQGDYKGTISGKLDIDCATSGNTENTYNGAISGVTFTDKDNKSKRSCTVRQNMTVTNCIAQNITPKYTSNNQPYQTITLSQNAAVWETPKFNMTVKVTQDGKTNSPTTDTLNYEWPTFTIGGQTFTPTNSNNISINGNGWPWVLGANPKFFSIKYPKIEDIYTKSNCSGSASCSISSANIGNEGGSKTITIVPNVTFKKKRYEGFSTRKWTLKCVSINPTVALDNKLSGWDAKQFTMNGITKHGYGSGIVTFAISGVSTSSSPFSSNVNECTFSASNSKVDETLDASKNDTYKKTFTISVGANQKVSGSWSASASNGTISISSTSKNKGTRSVDWSISSSTSEDGTVTMTSNSGTITQDDDIWDGTITVTGTGTGLSSCSTSIKYPANIKGDATGEGSYSLVSPVRRHLKGKGSMTCSGYWKDNYIYVNRDNNPSFDDDRALPYKITVSSNIEGTYPTNHKDGVILSGTVHDYDPSITTKYKLDGATTWSTSNKKYVGDVRTPHARVEPSVTKNSNTDETKGIYNSHNGTVQYYDSKSWTGEIQVTDDYDSTKTTTATCTITHAGTSATPITPSFKYTVTEFGCTVENVSGTNDGKDTPTFNYKANSAYDDGKHWKETSTTGSIALEKWDDVGSDHMNVKDGNVDAQGTLDSVTTYDNCEYGPSYDNSTWTQRKTGSITHYYDWYYGATISVNYNNMSNTFEHIGGSDNWVEQPDSNTTIYYLFVKWKGESNYQTKKLSKNASDINSTFRSQHKKYEDSWDWKVANSDGKDILASGSGSITVSFTTSTYTEYGYRVTSISISGGTTVSHTAFDDNPSSFTCTATVTANVGQYRTRTNTYNVDGSVSNGDWSAWTTEKTLTNTVTWACSGGSTQTGTSATANVTVNAGSNGSDGNDTTLTFTVVSESYHGESSNDTTSFTLKNYGKTYYNA